MVAEACGNRTHPARVRRYAGFEDQEGHQAQSASDSLNNTSYWRSMIPAQAVTFLNISLASRC